MDPITTALITGASSIILAIIAAWTTTKSGARQAKVAEDELRLKMESSMMGHVADLQSQIMKLNQLWQECETRSQSYMRRIEDLERSRDAKR